MLRHLFCAQAGSCAVVSLRRRRVVCDTSTMLEQKRYLRFEQLRTEGNTFFRAGEHVQAVQKYSAALRIAEQLDDGRHVSKLQPTFTATILANRKTSLQPCTNNFGDRSPLFGRFAGASLALHWVTRRQRFVMPRPPYLLHQTGRSLTSV